MPSRKRNIVIEQGSTVTLELAPYVDGNNLVIDLSGYSVNSQLRQWYTDNAATGSFTGAINTATGIVTLSLTANQSSNIPAGRYVYDVELTSGATVLRLQEGIATVTPEATR